MKYAKLSLILALSLIAAASVMLVFGLVFGLDALIITAAALMITAVVGHFVWRTIAYSLFRRQESDDRDPRKK